MKSDIPIEIQDPELRDRVEWAFNDERIIEAEPDEDKRLILALVDPVVRYSLVDDDSIYADDWEPTSPRLKEIIDFLTSEKLRPALAKWYSDQPAIGEMNSFAARFTKILERKTGMSLMKQ